ncbi:MAG TPA: hypothetical protein VFA07_17760 [Chthonomonadaceae bacterium]|nr:hypothetical protein [Chthonomonadaceae bacterium]
MRANLLIGGLAAGACFLWVGTAARAQEAISWETSYAAAQTKAKAADKLMMVDFYADW